jgi:hypothetical protein
VPFAARVAVARLPLCAEARSNFPTSDMLVAKLVITATISSTC